MCQVRAVSKTGICWGRLVVETIPSSASIGLFLGSVTMIVVNDCRRLFEDRHHTQCSSYRALATGMNP